jgi:hypothetical protein
MSDISMCRGTNCPQKETCYRYTAEPSMLLQLYYPIPPVQPDGTCNDYWDKNRKGIVVRKKK